MATSKYDSMPQLIPSSDQVMATLNKTGAFRHGHFAYPAGEHTPNYFQMPLALRHFQIARELGVAVSRLFRGIQEVSSALPKITIVTPGSGGIPLAFNAQVALGPRWSIGPNAKTANDSSVNTSRSIQAQNA